MCIQSDSSECCCALLCQHERPHKMEINLCWLQSKNSRGTSEIPGFGIVPPGPLMVSLKNGSFLTYVVAGAFALFLQLTVMSFIPSWTCLCCGDGFPELNINRVSVLANTQRSCALLSSAVTSFAFFCLCRIYVNVLYKHFCFLLKKSWAIQISSP